jgi:hypothetical protein
VFPYKWHPTYIFNICNNTVANFLKFGAYYPRPISR